MNLITRRWIAAALAFSASLGAGLLAALLVAGPAQRALAAPGDEVDLSLALHSAGTEAVPGQALMYTVVVSNTGPGDDDGAGLTTAPSPDFVPVEWRCIEDGGGFCLPGVAGLGPLSVTAVLPANSSITILVTGTVPPGATGSLTYTASITTSAEITDTDPTNNAGSLSLALVPHVSLSLSKTDGLTQVVAGRRVTYTLVAANAGPSTLAGGRLLDVLPAGLSGAAWTCQGSACPGSAGTELDASLTLPPLDSVTYILSAHLALGTPGPLVNTASFTAPEGTVGSPAAASDASAIAHLNFVPHVSRHYCPPVDGQEVEDNDGFATANPYGCLGRPWHARHDDPRDFAYVDLVASQPVTIRLDWPGTAKTAGVQLQVFREGDTSAPLIYRLTAPYVISGFAPPVTGRYFIYIFTDPATVPPQVDNSEYTLTIQP
jgi:uncharacterized repeat protein (TIGR01451 family)